MQWGDGRRIDPGCLRTRARTLHRVEAALTELIAAHGGIDLGPWRGEAHRAQRAAHRRLLSAAEARARRLAPTQDALDDAAGAFATIQAAQYVLSQRAAVWRYAITDSGSLADLAVGFALADPRRPVVRLGLHVSVTSIMMRLHAADVTLAGRLRVVETGANIVDGVVAVGDHAHEGLDWAGGKIAEGLDWGAGQIDAARDFGDDVATDLRSRSGHARTAFERLRETVGITPQWLRDLRDDGEVPQLSEVIGQGLYQAGQLAGIPVNFITNTDQRLFDDGRPYLASPQEVERHEGGDGRYGSAADLVGPMMAVYETHDPTDLTDRPQVQVTAVESSDGQVRYVAAIPGTTESLTQLHGWNGNPAGTDWAANLRGVGYGSTAATESIMHAIDLAIIEDQRARGLGEGLRPEVLLTGHSQGGLIAGNIANDPHFASRYDVGGVVSAGSPVETLGVPHHVPLYNYQNQADPVPRVDLGGLPQASPANLTTIEFAHDGNWNPGHTHAQGTYADNIHSLHGQVADGQVSDNASKQRQMDVELRRFFDGEATAYRVTYGRETD